MSGTQGCSQRIPDLSSTTYWYPPPSTDARTLFTITLEQPIVLCTMQVRSPRVTCPFPTRLPSSRRLSHGIFALRPAESAECTSSKGSGRFIRIHTTYGRHLQEGTDRYARSTCHTSFDHSVGRPQIGGRIRLSAAARYELPSSLLRVPAIVVARGF